MIHLQILKRSVLPCAILRPSFSAKFTKFLFVFNVFFFFNWNSPVVRASAGKQTSITTASKALTGVYCVDMARVAASHPHLPSTLTSARRGGAIHAATWLLCSKLLRQRNSKTQLIDKKEPCKQTRLTWDLGACVSLFNVATNAERLTPWSLLLPLLTHSHKYAATPAQSLNSFQISFYYPFSLFSYSPCFLLSPLPLMLSISPGLRAFLHIHLYRE